MPIVWNMSDKRIVKFSLMLAWVAVCVYVLFSYWTHKSAWIDGEIYTVFFLKMTLLTLPIGVITVTIGEYIISGLALLGLELSVYFSQQAATIVIWSTMTLTGLFQWFVLVPKLYSWILTKKSANASGQES